MRLAVLLAIVVVLTACAPEPPRVTISRYLEQRSHLKLIETIGVERPGMTLKGEMVFNAKTRKYIKLKGATARTEIAADFVDKAAFSATFGDEQGECAIVLIRRE